MRVFFPVKALTKKCSIRTKEMFLICCNIPLPCMIMQRLHNEYFIVDVISLFTINMPLPKKKT